MNLIRKLMLICLKSNICIRASHIPTKQNRLLISFTVGRFRRLAPQADPQPTPLRTCPHLGNLNWKENRILHCSLAPSSHKAYSAVLNKIHEFLSKYNFKNTWPVQVTQLLHFIGYLSTVRRSCRPVALYINAIS